MENKAEQYYPTYKSTYRDVVLVEFEEAQKIANGQTKVYGQVASILLGVVTATITLFFDRENENSTVLSNLVQSNALLFSAIIYIFGGFLLRYFVDLQKQITINARKVVTLRTMLGLDYGSIHLTMPNWRVEGATNPFVIKYFNGWLTFKSSPFWVLVVGVNIIWYLTIKESKPITFVFLNSAHLKFSWYIGNVIISISYLYLFRTNLNDRHETNFLNITKIISYFLGIKLVDNFEYVLYRAKLSYIELDRLNVRYDSLKKVLIEIEDRTFYNNNGVSIKSLLRGALSRLSFFRRKYNYIESGGSTITMQLVRTLFIPSNQNKFLRKFIEILLALWISNQFSKDEILRIYITSVRYERKVLGLSNAIKHFFGSLKDREVSNEESFFLVERFSNISSTFNWNRIDHLHTRVSIPVNKEKVRRIYADQLSKGFLKMN